VLTREALDHAFVAADVVLMPSRFESFGLVAIEAMAAGRPVLALAGGGLGEVARDAYGARTFADAPDVAERIVAELVWLNTDREELEMRSDQARAAWAALFSAEAMAQAIEQFSDAVLAQAGAAR
jgi:glycosyltransferase involved in cell wall biosynthesis